MDDELRAMRNRIRVLEAETEIKKEDLNKIKMRQEDLELEERQMRNVVASIKNEQKEKENQLQKFNEAFFKLDKELSDNKKQLQNFENESQKKQNDYLGEINSLHKERVGGDFESDQVKKHNIEIQTQIEREKIKLRRTKTAKNKEMNKLLNVRVDLVDEADKLNEKIEILQQALQSLVKSVKDLSLKSKEFNEEKKKSKVDIFVIKEDIRRMEKKRKGFDLELRNMKKAQKREQKGDEESYS